jgi:photosystem II stability/assembly factor-like uncharacterized protein
MMKKTLFLTTSLFFLFAVNAQWQVQNAGFSHDTLGFYEISIVNRNIVWAVCYDGKNGLTSGRPVLDFTRTTNGGNTWIAGKMGTDKSLQFSNISAISDREAWVAMHKLFSGGGGLYHTTDGGITWQQSNAGNIFDDNSFPNFVYFKDDKKGIAMGDPNNGYFEVYTTTNGGKKWKRVSPAKLPASLPNEFGFISGFAVIDNTIWFGTFRGRMYKSTNFGKDWTVSVVDPAGNFVNEIAFNDDKLHGVTHVRTATQTLLYSTSDGGLTWTLLGQPANWKSSRITAVPGTNALVSTSVIPSNQGSAVSYDNGITWTELERSAQKAAARFLDAQTGWAGGFFITGPPFSGGMYKSQIVFQTNQNDCHLPVNKSLVINETGKPAVTTAELVRIYPTPAQEVINISIPYTAEQANIMIQLFSSDGKLLQTSRATGSKLIRLNVSGMPSGVYIVSISLGKEIIRKVVSIAK